MNRRDFIDHIRKADYPEDITEDDLQEYYELFHDVGEDMRVKLFSRETLTIIGKAQTTMRNHAYKLMEEGRYPVKLPCGGYLKPHQDPKEPVRAKWKRRIPDNTPKILCQQEINRLLGEKVFSLLMEKAS